MTTAEVDYQVPSAVGEPRGRRSEASEPTARLALVVAPDRLIQHRPWEVIVSGTVARVSEVSARSDTSFEDAVNLGLSGQRDATWCHVGLDKGAVGGCGEREDCWLPRQPARHLRPRVASPRAYRGMSRVLATTNAAHATVATDGDSSWIAASGDVPKSASFPLALVVSEYLQPRSSATLVAGEALPSCPPTTRCVIRVAPEKLRPATEGKYGSRADLVGERVSDNYGGRLVHR